MFLHNAIAVSLSDRKAFVLILKTQKAKSYHILGALWHESDACDQIERDGTKPAQFIERKKTLQIPVHRVGSNHFEERGCHPGKYSKPIIAISLTS